jgi:hypothetical protein
MYYFYNMCGIACRPCIAVTVGILLILVVYTCAVFALIDQHQTPLRSKATPARAAIQQPPPPAAFKRRSLRDTTVVPSSAPTQARATTAYATLLSAGTSLSPYVAMVTSWVRQLLCHGIQGRNIVVLVASNVPQDAYSHLASLNVTLRRVPVLTATGTSRYSDTCTKLWIWSLTAWSRVVYYDADVFFLRSPEACAAMCPSDATLCAVRDPAGAWPRRDDRYFNSGFMVIRPSNATLAFLQSNVHRANGRTFGDQDLLNDVFKPDYVALPRICNFLHASDDAPRAVNSGVAVHEKLDVIRSLVPHEHRIRRCADI